MRTHRTVYRVLGPDGTEVYRGKRSAVLRKLATMSRTGTIGGAVVEHGRYDPTVEDEPREWVGWQLAESFLAGR